jgi:hypothetical protein
MLAEKSHFVMLLIGFDLVLSLAEYDANGSEEVGFALGLKNFTGRIRRLEMWLLLGEYDASSSPLVGCALGLESEAHLMEFAICFQILPITIQSTVRPVGRAVVSRS